MKKLSLATIVVATAAALSLGLAACSAGGTASSAGTAAAIPVEQLSASVVKVNLDGSNDVREAQVTINEGESYVVASGLESGQAETVLKYTDGDMSDNAYEGFGVGTSEVAAGTYDVIVTPDGAVGTIYVLSYPADDLAVMDVDAEELFNQVVDIVARVA